MQKQAYKLELPKWWRIHNVFHLSLLEQDTTKKYRVDKRVTELETGNSKEYKIEAIWDNAVYANELKSGHLPGLYYLIAWKSYSKEENTWEHLSTVQYVKKLISYFHKEHPKKPTATFLPINFVPPMARPTVRPTLLKWKQGQPAGDASK